MGEGRQRHEQMYRYTQDLAIEYTTDFENKIQYGGYSLEEEDIIAQEYRKALADKVGKFVPEYQFDKDDERFDENEWLIQNNKTIKRLLSYLSNLFLQEIYINWLNQNESKYELMCAEERLNIYLIKKKEEFERNM